jgi:dTDP-4-dehydrorhamnose reductase
VPLLKSRGHEVLAHGRTAPADVVADLLDPGAISSSFSRAAPDVVVNLAASTDVDECERNPQGAYLANVRVVENVSDWIRRAGGGCHLVQVSTDQIYDGPGPHGEDQVTIMNYYAFSKYAGELAALSVPSTVLRTTFFGPSKSPGKSSLSDWLVNAMRKGDAITVFDDVLFTPLSMQRLSETLDTVIAQRHPGVFNLGSRDGMSKADFAFALASAMGLPVASVKRGTSDSVKLRAYRPKDMRMDSSRFQRAFGVTLPTLQEEITSMKEAYADR